MLNIIQSTYATFRFRAFITSYINVIIPRFRIIYIITLARSIYSRRLLAGVFPRKRLRLRRDDRLIDDGARERGDWSNARSLSFSPTFRYLSFTAIALVESIFLFCTRKYLHGREFTGTHHRYISKSRDAYRACTASKGRSAACNDAKACICMSELSLSLVFRETGTHVASSPANHKLPRGQMRMCARVTVVR